MFLSNFNVMGLVFYIFSIAAGWFAVYSHWHMAKTTATTNSWERYRIKRIQLVLLALFSLLPGFGVGAALWMSEDVEAFHQNHPDRTTKLFGFYCWTLSLREWLGASIGEAERYQHFKHRADAAKKNKSTHSGAKKQQVGLNLTKEELC